LSVFPCGTGSLSATQETAIRNQNDQYPFNFTKSPWSLRATVTLPIFNGFLREQRVEEAVAARNNARTLVRARELQLTADVTAAYLTLATAQKTVAVQEQNAARARDELRLTEERYRVGAATFLDVVQARATYERAESDRINAVYDYHKAFAALESAVGRPLR
ncbi:MAG: TolC family protein, partial [Gemmatimonadaceae bacterium]|nr:TolC family protein [Gemmatimonadaceae bacterium]